MVRWPKQCRPSITCTMPRLTSSLGVSSSTRSPRNSILPLVTSPRSPRSKVEIAFSVVLLPAPLAAEQGDDLAFRNCERYALQHQYDVVINDLDIADGEISRLQFGPGFEYCRHDVNARSGRATARKRLAAQPLPPHAQFSLPWRNRAA